MKYCRVTQRLAQMMPDEAGLWDDVSGRVRFTSSLPRGQAYQVETDSGIKTVPRTLVEAEIVGGEIVSHGSPGVEVFAGGENSNPPEAYWRVEYLRLEAKGLRLYLEGFTFLAIPDGEIDLTEVTPVAAAEPQGITKGDKGDKGDSVTVTGYYFDEVGDSVVEFSDGSTTVVKRGIQGVPGQDGDSITITSESANAQGDIELHFSDGTEITIPKGDKGDPGLTPYIKDMVWWVGDESTGVLAQGPKGDQGIAPDRSPITINFYGTGDPVLSDFPDAQVGDLIERVSDGQRWKVEES